MNVIKNQSFQIVASDLDGTLLAPDHQLSTFSKQTLKELHEKGYTFVFATGRHHVDVAQMRKQVGIPAYMITSNGARVHNQKDDLMYSKNLDESLVQPIVDIIKKDPKIRIHIYQNDSWLMNQEDEEIKKYHKDSGFHYTVFDVEQAPTTGIAKLFFTYPDHDYLVTFEDQLNKQFAGRISVVFSTPWCLEVMAYGVSKGEALKAVANSIGSSLDKCIAFGDGMNDVEMLSMAGKGLVMQTSHEKVKKALPDNEVIGSNENHAVAHYLKKHLF
ncbi:Cof-type HAD-IIB family hydrolase [Vibrio sp. MA40-2]|uniref:Cof-type HAD-IIB family hydrolase n=1 Tax=Vibrio sp. MA40-2 TaxID=3391828 RepID=UPI0039A42BDD